MYRPQNYICIQQKLSFISLEMGGVSSQQHSQLFNWVNVGPHVYLNSVTGQVINHQQVTLQKQHDISQYNKRINIARPYVVRLLYFRRVVANQFNCHQNNSILDVFVEGALQSLQHVYKKHSSLGDIKCYCQQITKGFENLKQCYGPLQVSYSMIWVDRHNNAKVWLNQNYFLNYFKPAKQNLMVLQISQILLKLPCRCKKSFEEELSFSFLTNKSISNSFKYPILNTAPPHSKIQSFSRTAPGLKNQSFEIKCVSSPKKQLLHFSIANSPKKLEYQSNINNNCINNKTVVQQAGKFSYYYPQHYKTKLIKIQQFKIPKFLMKNNVSQNFMGQNKPNNFIRNRNNLSNGQQTKCNGVGFIPRKKNNSQFVMQHSTHTNQQLYKNKVVKTFKSVRCSSQKSTSHKFNKKLITFNQPTLYAQSSNTQRIKCDHDQKKKVDDNLCSTNDKKSKSSSNNLNSQPNNNNIRSKTKILAFETEQQNIGISNSQGIAQKSWVQKLEKIKQDGNFYTFNACKLNIQGIVSEINSSCSNTHRETIQNAKVEKNGGLDNIQINQQGNYILKDVGNGFNFEYKVPEKTKKLIQKYLTKNLNEQNEKDKAPSKSITQHQQHGDLLQKQQQNLLQEKKAIKLNSLLSERSHLYQKYLQAQFTKHGVKTIDEQKDSIQCAQQPIQNCKIKIDNEQIKSNIYFQNYERQQLKKQMKLVFCSPESQQQNSIRDKIARKKEIFADLKAQAFKILDAFEG